MVIIDTSVAIKVFFDEKDSDRAKELAHKNDVGAPDLLLYEFSNYLTHRPLLSTEETEKSLELLTRTVIQLFSPTQSLLLKSIVLAKSFDLSLYDASFVTLAQSLELDFFTADMKLAKKVESLSFVHTL